MYFCSTFMSLGCMKKLLWAFMLLMVLFVACTGSQKPEELIAEAELPVDTQQIVQQDTLTQEEVAEALPARADELFDDFLFNYCQDSLVQMRRTAFPLPYTKDGEIIRIKRTEWKKEPLFSNMEFYSVLYNSQKDFELDKDTSLNRVRMEYLYLDRKEVKRYCFLRNQKGFWILYKIVEEPFNEQSEPIEFLEFYHKFANDSIFQREHISPKLNFITFDPDDEFRTVEFEIDVDQWFAFQPKLPTTTLTQVNYGQNVTGATDKIVNFRGSTNGFNNTLTFHKKEDTWILTNFEDTSE